MRWVKGRGPVVALAVIGLVAVGLWSLGGHFRPGASGQPPRLAEGAVVIYRTTYLVCGAREETTRSAEPDLVGLSAAEVLARHPGWDLVSFAPGRVELERRVDGMCPEMVTYRFLTIADGKVTVYYGRRREHLLLKEISPARAEGLLPEDRAALEQGIVVVGDEALAQFLEGLGD